MNLRPQGPEIIRTWLFDTVVRARLEHDALPWTDTTINGWVLDPDRKKMSKSKGNVVTPMPLVEEYGADALRYWACNGRPGVDTAVDFGVMKVGRKLAIKVLNASKFVLGVSGDAAEDAERGRDRARPFVARRRSPSSSTTRPTRSTAFDYARSLQRTEAFFWSFCDDYVELVKSRAYGDAGDASGALGRGHAAHRVVDVAPSVRARAARTSAKRCGRGGARARSIAPTWPTAVGRCGVDGADPLVYEVAAEVLAEVRKAKSTQKVSLATPVASVHVVDTAERLAALEAARARRVRRRQDRQARGRGRHRVLGAGRAGRGAGVVSDPAGFDGPSWLSSHVNLESLNVPAGSRRGPPTLERISTLMQYLGSPEIEFPAVHVTGTNGKTTTVRVLTELLTRARPEGRRVHEPAPRARERAHVDRRRNRSTTTRSTRCSTRSRSSRSRSASTRRTSTSSPRPRSVGSPTKPSTSRWSRSEWAATWDATNVVDGRVAVVTNVTHRSRRVSRADARADRAGEGRHREAGRDARARRDRSRHPGDLRSSATPARVFRRDVDFGVSRNVLAIGGRLVDLRSPGAEYPDVFLPLHGAHQADNAAIALAAAESFVERAAPVRRRRRRVLARAVSRSARGRAPPTARVARRRAQRRRRAGVARRARRGVERRSAHARRRHAAREGTARDARGARRRRARRLARVLSAADAPRARAVVHRQGRASISGFPRNGSRSSTASRTRSSTALLATPPDGQIVITGSLYVVGAARSVLVS